MKSLSTSSIGTNFVLYSLAYTGDINNDRVAEIIVSMTNRNDAVDSVICLNGADLTAPSLWTYTIGNGTNTTIPLVAKINNNNGAKDILVYNTVTHSIVRLDSHGNLIWQATLGQGSCDSALQIIPVGDSTADGQMDFVVGAATIYQCGLPVMPNVYFVDGSNGNIYFTIADRYIYNQGQWGSYGAAALPDINGNNAKDIVLAGRNSGSPLEIRDGLTGNILFSHPTVTSGSPVAVGKRTIGFAWTNHVAKIKF